MHSATQQQHGRGGGEQQQSPSVLPADMPPVPTSTAAKRPDLFGVPDPHQPAASAPPRPSAHDDLSPAGDDAAAATEGAAAAAAQQQQQQQQGGGGGGMVAGSRSGATAATATAATATTAATAKGAPPENGLDAIMADHQVIRQLFCRCNNAQTHQERLCAVRDLVRHISRHASAEERTLYPLARDRLGGGTGKMLYDRMVMDDSVNKHMLDWLEGHTPQEGDAQQWALHAATLQKFQSVEEEHLSREEAEVIEPLRAVMSQGELAKLGRQWSSAWASAPTHPHPRGPSAAPGAALLHPLVGVVDRLWDAVAER